MNKSVSFANAPLIEIVAELRWLPKGFNSTTFGQPQLIIGGNDNEAAFYSFIRQPELLNFTSVERIVPPGFPVQWQQVVWRLRDPKKPGVLLQLGPGIFTANALQPYKRWQDFRPSVQGGITALLQSRGTEEIDQKFTGLSLRYINGFTSSQMGDVSASKFMSDVLRFSVQTPEAIKRQSGNSSLSGTSLNLTVPILNKTKTLIISIGDGTVRPADQAVDSVAVVLDLTVMETAVVEPTLDNVLQTFDSSRDIIHDVFIEITADIQKVLKPEN